MMLGTRSLWGWLLLLGIALGVQGCSREPPQVQLGTQAESMQKEGKGCVEPTDVMRAHHMEFLFHQRDATVHEGIRTVKHSLNACIACHVSHDAQGEPVPINAGGQFCQACHAYASVGLDCFDCHATKPTAAQSVTQAPLPAATLVPASIPASAAPAAQEVPAAAAPVASSGAPPEQVVIQPVAESVAAPAAASAAEVQPQVPPPVEVTSVVVPVEQIPAAAPTPGWAPGVFPRPYP